MRSRQVYLSLVVLAVATLQFLFPHFFQYLASFRLFPSHLPLVTSASIALLPIRILNAFVFLWFAFDNLESPVQFSKIGNLFLAKIGLNISLELRSMSYALGMVELLIAILLLTGFFLDLAGLLGTLVVLAVVVVFKVGNGTLLVRNLGILGAALSLMWLTL